jgi:hypothetical protein
MRETLCSVDGLSSDSTMVRPINNVVWMVVVIRIRNVNHFETANRESRATLYTTIANRVVERANDDDRCGASS